MRDAAPLVTSTTQSTMGLPARLALLAATLFLDKVLLNAFVAFDHVPLLLGLGRVLRVTQHWGLRFLVALAAAIAVFAYVRGGPRLRAAAAHIGASALHPAWGPVHAGLIALLALVSYFLFRPGPGVLASPVLVGIGLLLASGAVAAAFAALAPWTAWWQLGRSLGSTWLYALLAAIAGACAMQWSQELWAPTAGLTFDLVQHVLAPVVPSLTGDSHSRVLTTSHFSVQISEACSGLEGVGLMLAFCCAWLLFFRREYIFPRALLLIPVGLLLIFALNVLRIAALVLIGHAGFPGVAVYGFHSQAGWIAFNGAACGVAFLSRRSRWLNRTACAPTAAVAGAAAAAATENPTAAYLMPLLAILFAGTVARAASSGFEWLYPLRLLCGAGVLWAYRRHWTTLTWRFSARGVAGGALIFLVWLFAAHQLLAPAGMPGTLATASPPLRAFWIACRAGAAVLTVPLAEELAYRGYLMRRLSARDFDAVAFARVRWTALLASSLVFGLAHGTLWLPGAAAGLVYGAVLIRTGSMGEAVVAHATSNALIVAAVLVWHQWQLW